MRVLIVEDEPALRESMATFLGRKMAVDIAGTLGEADASIAESAPDAVVLDLTLPDGDGLTWLKTWRPLLAAKVLVVTANDQESAMLTGLALADDYVVKPVSLRVLVARLEKLLPSAVLAMGPLTVDLARGEVRRGSELVPLSATEWRLVSFLAQHQGQLLTRDQLLALWDASGSFVSDNTLTVTMRRLREKLEQPGELPLIRTVRGMGYFINGENTLA
ncbi:response regulator transcription factor [Lacticaseibacillus mingshuiensis]|uniref:Response regulator transcription factor n=1 Tax=Lacticaseibacillus mingshuiensis TaxID=2799574 RepID=A0ABW4CKC7_9LACO|nr:response regulator transcription factor [Lacticaseibacillus mingshuiensis]